MTKRVFIVGSPLQDKFSVFHRGVVADVNNFYRYFLSPTGGGFFENEITYLENPSWSTLKFYLDVLSADFVVFVFSGHGYYSNIKNRTVFQINDFERASLRTITSTISAPKKLIISDSCRNFREDEFYYVEGIGDPDKYMSFYSDLSVSQARTLFNNKILNSFDGTQVIYSCSPGESSVITSSGSVFCNSLLTSIDRWANGFSNQSIMTGGQAFKLTERNLYYSNQTPQCKVSSPHINFPLALKKPTYIRIPKSLY